MTDKSYRNVGGVLNIKLDVPDKLFIIPADKYTAWIIPFYKLIFIESKHDFYVVCVCFSGIITVSDPPVGIIITAEGRKMGNFVYFELINVKILFGTAVSDPESVFEEKAIYD